MAYRIRSREKMDSPASSITTRQLEVMTLLAEGFSMKIIPHILGISLHCAYAHRASLMDRLDIHKEALLIFHYWKDRESWKEELNSRYRQRGP